MSNHLYGISTDFVEHSVSIAGGLSVCPCDPCPLCKSFTNIVSISSTEKRVSCPERKWPDSIYCRGGAVVFSSRVVSSLEKAGISCFQKKTISFLDVPKSKQPDTSFFFILPVTTVNANIAFSLYTKPYICTKCGRFDHFSFNKKYWDTNICAERTLVENEYKGEDIVLVRFYGQYSIPYCTGKFIDLCRENKWTNFVFYDNLHNPKGQRIQHHFPNWRELLEQDIAREEARLRGENPDPIQISIPAMPPKKSSPKPVSDHPFDNLSEFDGTAWQGTDSLPWAFGLYDFIVYEDENAESEVENEDDDLPTAGQRALFDYFRSIQEALLPQLYDVLMKGLQKIGILFTARIASYADLAQVLDSGDLEIRNTSPRGKGILSLGYSTKDKKHDLIVRIACTPSRKLFRVLSCRGE